MKRIYVYLIGCSVFVLFAGAADKVQPTITTWDGGNAEGWVVLDGGSATFPLTGGVTGGFMQVEDVTTGTMYAAAPVKYLGDYTDMENVGYFSVAVRTLVQGETIWGEFGTLTMSGPGGKYKVDMGQTPPPSSGWIIFSVPIIESAWTRVSGSWAGLLVNVTSVTFVVEGYAPVQETNGMDNFELGVGQLDTPRIEDILVNRCYKQEFGWYFIGYDGIERIDIIFSEDMSGAGNLSNYEFSTDANKPPIPLPVYIYYDSISHTTTIAWASAIMNQSMSVHCLSGATKIRSASLNLPLDGEISNSDIPTFPSGNGTVGGDAVFTARHLTADINRDKRVDLQDFSGLADNWLETVE